MPSEVQVRNLVLDFTPEENVSLRLLLARDPEGSYWKDLSGMCLLLSFPHPPCNSWRNPPTELPVKFTSSYSVPKPAGGSSKS